MFSELNHRIKNNMQMLGSLLRVAQRETANREARLALGDAIQRVGAMAAAQKVFYQQNNAVAFNARDFISSVCATASLNLGDGITVHCDAVADELSNDTAVPLALILNELLANAAKHGINGRGKGIIKVGLAKVTGSFVLSVEDDGAGFVPGETRRRSSGLGLVRGLAKQIGGTFEVECVPGARCIIRFPGDHHIQ